MIGINGAAQSVQNVKTQDKAPASAPIAVPNANFKASQNKTPVNQPLNDHVELSNQSKELSQLMLQKKAIEQIEQADEAKRAENSAEKKTLSAVEIVKYYPPYLNNERRQEILQNYPLFRKQIDQMTVPQPPNAFQESQNQSVQTTNVITEDYN